MMKKIFVFDIAKVVREITVSKYFRVFQEIWLRQKVHNVTELDNCLKRCRNRMSLGTLDRQTIAEKPLGNGQLLKKQYFALKICFSCLVVLYLQQIFLDFDVSKSSLEVGSFLHQPLFLPFFRYFLKKTWKKLQFSNLIPIFARANIDST